MKTILASDPVRRMDEIVQQLTALYSEADRLLDDYIVAICTSGGIPKDLIEQRARRRLEDA
jgi:hypothetical protein